MEGQRRQKIENQAVFAEGCNHRAKFSDSQPVLFGTHTHTYANVLHVYWIHIEYMCTYMYKYIYTMNPMSLTLTPAVYSPLVAAPPPAAMEAVVGEGWRRWWW